MKINYIHNEIINKESNPITFITEGKNQQAPLIKFHCFEDLDFINYGFSTRLGGASKGIFSSMNLSFNRGDDTESVSKNFEIIAHALGTKPENMVYSMQTHTTNVLKVGVEECGMGVIRERNFQDIDGLVTNEPGVCLVTSYADCVPLFFVDKSKRCIGLSHSGWRGTVGKIAVNTVHKMIEEFQSDPKDIVAFIGPSICQDCYEVSKDVAELFMKAYHLNQINDILEPKPNEKFQLNLHQANYYNMLEAGLKPENIHVTDICTCCNPDLLFSHRASKGQRGGLCAFLEIKK